MEIGKLQNNERTLQNCHLAIEQRVEVIKPLDHKMSYRDIDKTFGVSHVVDDNFEVNRRVHE